MPDPAGRFPGATEHWRGGARGAMPVQDEPPRSRAPRCEKRVSFLQRFSMTVLTRRSHLRKKPFAFNALCLWHAYRLVLPATAPCGGLQ